MHDCCLSFIFNCPLIDYFLKKNYSLRQNIFEKHEGLREVTHISPNWCLFRSYWSWDLIGNRQHEGLWRFAGKRVTGRCTELWSPVFGQFIGGELLLRRSDQMLKQCFPSVRSDGDPVFGRSKMKVTTCFGLWLSPVKAHRTCPVAISRVLDLSRIDRTLGGSVRSLSLERSVSCLEIHVDWPDAGTLPDRTLKRRVRSLLQPLFTSCELTERWTAESGAASGHSFLANLQCSSALPVSNQVPT